MQTQRAELNESDSPIKEGWTEVHQYNKADWKARIGVALVGGGVLACGAINLLANGANFVRDCYNENAARYLFNFSTTDLAGCGQEIWPMLQSFLGK